MHLQEQKHKGEVWRDQQETCEILKKEQEKVAMARLGRGFSSQEKKDCTLK